MLFYIDLLQYFLTEFDSDWCPQFKVFNAAFSLKNLVVCRVFLSQMTICMAISVHPLPVNRDASILQNEKHYYIRYIDFLDKEKTFHSMFRFKTKTIKRPNSRDIFL